MKEDQEMEMQTISFAAFEAECARHRKIICRLIAAWAVTSFALSVTLAIIVL